MTLHRPRCAWCHRPFKPRNRAWTGDSEFCCRTCERASKGARGVYVRRRDRWRKAEEEN